MRTPDPQVSPGHGAGTGSLLSRVRAWMLVLPVDAVLLAAPVLWAPQQWRAHLAMAVLGLNLLGDGLRDLLDPKLARAR